MLLNHTYACYTNSYIPMSLNVFTNEKEGNRLKRFIKVSMPPPQKNFFFEGGGPQETDFDTGNPDKV